MITIGKKLKEELERNKNWYNLLLPKLEAVKNGGNGTTIHTANGHINLLTSALYLANRTHVENRAIWIHNLSNYLDAAEKWLISITSKGSNNE